MKNTYKPSGLAAANNTIKLSADRSTLRALRYDLLIDGGDWIE